MSLFCLGFRSFLVAFFLLSLLLPVSAQNGSPLSCPGDVNLDGDRAAGDLSLLSAHLSGKMVLEGKALENADVNLDQIVDVGDVTRLLSHTTDKFPLIPCGEFDPVEIACPGLSIAETSAAPLEEVPLGSLPEELQEPILALVTEREEQIGILAFVERLEDGSATLTVPFYPGATLEGGPVDVQITDGFSACPPTSFSIDPIPPSPGEFSRAVDALQGYVDDRAEELGLNTEDLISVDGEIPSYVIPLAIAQRLLDHPENLNSLRAIDEGTAPILEDATDNTVLDGVSAWLNLADLFGVASPLRAMPAQAGGPTLACGDSVENLDACMIAATADELDRPNQEAALSLLAMKLFPGGRQGGSAAKAVFDKIGATTELSLAVQNTASKAAKNLLPSRFVSFKVDAGPESMEEDSDEDGEWSAELTAMSQGFKLTFSRSEFLTQLARIPFTGPKAMRAVELAEKFFPGQGASLGNKIGTLLGNSAKEVAPEAQEDDTNFEIPPETFGPVSAGLNEEEWTRVEIRGNAVEQVGHKKYRAARASDAAEPTKIRVEVRTDEGRFGGVDSISADAGVEVQPIELEISPVEQTFTSTQREVSFTVEVENAEFPEKVEVLDPERGSAQIEHQGENMHRVTYTAPVFTPQGFSESLTVRYNGETGARRPELDPPERKAEAEVKKLEVLISGENCVEAGSNDNRYTAEIVGLEDQEVSWEVSNGNIGPNGVFDAPDSPGEAVITATSQSNPNVKGEAYVKVGGCDCWWSVKVGGRAPNGLPRTRATSESGDDGYFFRNDDQVFISFGTEDRSANISFQFTEQSIGVSGGLGLAESDLGFAYSGDNQDGNGQISGNLTENTAAAVAGFLTGSVEVTDLDTENIESFELEFRLTDDPDYFGIFLGCVVE